MQIFTDEFKDKIVSLWPFKRKPKGEVFKPKESKGAVMKPDSPEVKKKKQAVKFYERL